MEFVDDGSDTLDLDEQRDLQSIASAEFGSHECELRTGERGTAWVILRPLEPDSLLPTFTICRVDPSLIVMVEHYGAQRELYTVTDIAHAAHILRTTTQAYDPDCVQIVRH